jgi:hypothetical protein
LKEQIKNSYLQWLVPVHFFTFVLMLLCFRFWLEDGFWQYPRMVAFFLIGYGLTAVGVLGSSLPPSTKRWGYLLLGVVLGCWLKP